MRMICEGGVGDVELFVGQVIRFWEVKFGIGISAVT